MRAKRRYIQRRFHPAFGYYIGASIVVTQTETRIRSLAPGCYGRPELNSESTELAFPLVWNADEARELFNRRERFAFISQNGKAGFYGRRRLQPIRESNAGLRQGVGCLPAHS